MSTALPRQAVEKAIDKLAKPELRRWCRRMYHKVLELKEHGKLKKKGVDQPDGNWYRLESETFARRMPELAITADDRAKMHELHNVHNCSFREIEEIFHLSPQSGNAASRGCNKHSDGKRLVKSIKTKPRMTKAMFVSIAKDYLKQQKPNRAKAVFKEIEAILAKRKSVVAV